MFTSWISGGPGLGWRPEVFPSAALTENKKERLRCKESRSRCSLHVQSTSKQGYLL